MTDVRNRRRARATAIALAEDARQALVRRALLAVSGGLIAAVAVAALAMRGMGY